MMLNAWIQPTAKTKWTFLISVYTLSGYTWSISVHLQNFKTYNGSRRIRCNCVQKTQRLNLKSQKYGILIFKLIWNSWFLHANFKSLPTWCRSWGRISWIPTRGGRTWTEHQSQKKKVYQESGEEICNLSGLVSTKYNIRIDSKNGLNSGLLFWMRPFDMTDSGISLVIQCVRAAGKHQEP